MTWPVGDGEDRVVQGMRAEAVASSHTPPRDSRPLGRVCGNEDEGCSALGEGRTGRKRGERLEGESWHSPGLGLLVG